MLGREGDDEEAAAELGFPAFATRNTTRVGGADPIADAAGVAQAVFPSRDRDTRPRAVTLVDTADWRVAVSAAQLMSAPLRAPLLFSERGELPAATEQALGRLIPTGAKEAGGAQVIRVGEAAVAEGYKTTDVEGADHAALAQAIDRLQSAAAGKPSPAVVVASSDQPGFSMPAAGWAAKSGDPVLWVTRDAIPAATRAAITAHKRPRIYVLGPESAVSKKVLDQLGELGDARRISGADPVANAIAFARFSDGSFGWNVVDPGHGLVFAEHAAAARRRRRGAALGVRDLRPAAARHRGQRPAGAAAGLPARHPARLRQGPGARGLQPRLDDRRRERRLGRRPGADRLAARDPGRRRRRRRVDSRAVAEAEQPERLRPEHRVTVDDVRQLMGASTPHFALQLRNRIRKLIAPLPPGDPARLEGEREIARLERLAFAGEVRGEQGDGERSLRSVGEDEPTRYAEGPTRG